MSKTLKEEKKRIIEERIIDMGWCLYENELTLREVAKRFKVSKTTAHRYLTKRLPELSTPLAKEVEKVLEKNKSERSVRGGQATKNKYSLKK